MKEKATSTKIEKRKRSSLSNNIAEIANDTRKEKKNETKRKRRELENKFHEKISRIHTPISLKNITITRHIQIDIQNEKEIGKKMKKKERVAKLKWW